MTVRFERFARGALSIFHIGRIVNSLMNKFAEIVVWIFCRAVGAAAIVALFYFTAWAKESAPAINVDNTPIVRDAKAVTSFAPVVKKAAPSVVNIYSTQIIHERLYRNPMFNDPFFRQFFGDPSGQNGGNQRDITRKEQSLGSGIIISPDGYILTANHVVDGMDEIKVAIPDSKKEYTAKVVGTDPPTDVAVLKIDATGLPAITLGDSDQLEVGDVVLAIGNPFGVGQSVTMGIVSALGRNGATSGCRQRLLHSGFHSNRRRHQSGKFRRRARGCRGPAHRHQHDDQNAVRAAMKASVSPCPSISRAASWNASSAAAGWRAVISASGCRTLMPISPSSSICPSQNGVLVDDVMPDGPADKAGIKSGDVIVAFNGKEVDDGHSLQLAVVRLRARFRGHREIDPRRRRKKPHRQAGANCPASVAQNGNAKIHPASSHRPMPSTA